MATELIQRLNALSEIIADDNTAKRISQVAAIRVLAKYKQRIFYLGLSTSGEPIGQYSINPFYINPNADVLKTVASRGIKAVGKFGQTVFKNGKPHKTKYLANGYAQLRQDTGRQNANVDLNFSGSLFGSIKVEESGLISYITYTNDKLADVMLAQEIHFAKDIAAPSEEEIAIGEEAARLELLAILEDLDLA